LDAAVKAPVIVVSPVIDNVDPLNLKFVSPFSCPAVPVAVIT